MDAEGLVTKGHGPRSQAEHWHGECHLIPRDPRAGWVCSLEQQGRCRVAPYLMASGSLFCFIGAVPLR